MGDIEIYAQEKKIPRSQVIEDVLFTWQRELKKREMIEGYRAMSHENAQIAEEFSTSSEEAWPDE